MEGEFGRYGDDEWEEIPWCIMAVRWMGVCYPCVWKEGFNICSAESVACPDVQTGTQHSLAIRLVY